MSDPNKFKVAKDLGRKDFLFGLARVPNSARVFVGNSEGKVLEFDLAAEKPEPKEMPGHQGYVLGVARAGDFVISGAYDGRLVWWKAETREQVRAIDAHAKAIRGVVATPDGKQIVSVADDMVARVWNAESGEKVHELKGHAELTPSHYPSMLYAVSISPDGQHVATADKVGKINVWELASGKAVSTFEAPEHYTWDPKQRRHSIGGIRSLAFSPDGQQLAIGGMGKVGNIDHLEGKALVHLHSWRDGKRQAELAHDKLKGLVEQLRYHHEGKWLVAAGGAGEGFVWFIDPAAKNTITQDKAPMHVHAIALDETSEKIYASGHGKLAVWEQKG